MKSRRVLLLVAHTILALLVLLLLVLGAVSGPSTRYWWMTVEYSGKGEAWNLGGLGACQVGQRWVAAQCEWASTLM